MAVATDASPLRLSQVTELYGLAIAVKSHGYQRWQRRALNWYGEFLGRDLPIDEALTDVQLEMWGASLLNGREPGTVRQYMASLRTVAAWCKRKRYLRENPLLEVDLPRKTKRERRVLSAAEACALVGGRSRQRAARDRDRTLVLFLLGTGARISEALTLRWEAIDYAQQRVKLFGKGRKERMVPLDAGVLVALAALEAQCRAAPMQRVFPLEVRTAQHKIAAMARRARIGLVTPHQLRHTFATECIKAGVPVAIVQRWMGHANISTTMVYVHLAEADLEAARPTVLQKLRLAN